MTNKTEPKKIEIALSNILRIGLLITIFTILTGGVLLFFQMDKTYVDKTINYSVFRGEPLTLSVFSSVFQTALKGDAAGVIQLGILFMILTPISRVALCAFLFLKEQNYLYVALSSFVLSVLIYSLF